MSEFQDFRYPLNFQEKLVSAAGANEDINIGPVPSGHLWVINNIAIEDEDNAFTSLRISITGYGEDHHLVETITVAQDALQSYPETYYIPEGRTLRIRFVGSTSADLLTAYVSGFDVIQPKGAKHA